VDEIGRFDLHERASPSLEHGSAAAFAIRHLGCVANPIATPDGAVFARGRFFPRMRTPADEQG
jgi:hypothetical protein